MQHIRHTLNFSPCTYTVQCIIKREEKIENKTEIFLQ